MTQYSNKKGQSIILNSGSMDNVCLTDTDRFKKFSMSYNVGLFNQTFIVLQQICQTICDEVGLSLDMKDLKKPWKIDETNNMVKIFTANTKRPAVMNSDRAVVEAKLARDGGFAKINVTPNLWVIEEESFYTTPDGGRHKTINTKKGINLWLNGVLLVNEEDIF